MIAVCSLPSSKSFHGNFAYVLLKNAHVLLQLLTDTITDAALGSTLLLHEKQKLTTKILVIKQVQGDCICISNGESQYAWLAVL